MNTSQKRIGLALLVPLGFISLSVLAQTSAVFVGSNSPPFDLIWSKVDASGVPINPQWRWRVGHGDSDPSTPDPDALCAGFPLEAGRISYNMPPCTSQQSTINLDYPTDILNGLTCAFSGETGHFKGHVNWGPGSYYGKIYWNSKSSPIEDDDYNFDLAPQNASSMIRGNNGFLHVEFDSDETIDHFLTPWWTRFHRAVDQNFASLITGSDGTVIGLVGIDTEHTLATEIHPVWGIAIHDFAQQAPTDDVWGIFARNWGNEGWCGQSQHYLYSNNSTMTFHIPWRANATAVFETDDFLAGPDGLSQSDLNQATGPNITWSPPNPQTGAPGGVQVSFSLPRPEAGAYIEGELHLQWSFNQCDTASRELANLLASLNQLESSIPANKANIPGIESAEQRRVDDWHRQHDAQVAQLRKTIAACEPAGGSHAIAVMAHAPSAERDVAEERLAQVYSSMTSAQLATYKANLIMPKLVPGTTRLKSASPMQRVDTLSSAISATAVKVRVGFAPDGPKSAIYRSKLKALCAAFQGNPPGMGKACSANVP